MQVDDRTDQELLGAYARTGDEAAFSLVVHRYMDMVYSVALRIVCDNHLAEDVSQQVFLALAQRASSLDQHAVLAGWLHRTTHHISANIVRTEVRRRNRENQTAVANNLLARNWEPSWSTVAPHLDDALCELPQPDRDVLVLRYCQGLSAREIAQMLGTSSEAAQKRVTRALDRIRDAFTKRGIMVGTAALVGLMTDNALQAAPIGLAASLSAGALAHAASSAPLVSTGTKLIIMTTLQKTIVSTVILAAVGAAVYQLHHTNRQAVIARITESSASTPQSNRLAPSPQDKTPRQRPRSRRPFAPPTQVAKSSAPTAARPFTSTQLYQFLKSKAPVLSVARLESFLSFNQRSAPALLAAFRTTSDPALLSEAMERYPTDAQVAFEAAIRNGLSPDERRQWLNTLKQADPENSLASYLSAADHLKAGQPAEAIQDLTAAASISQFRDYSEERIQDNEQAYLAAGYSPGEAKLLANNFIATPYLVQLRELGQDLVSLAGTYRNSGDESSRQVALEVATNLGRQLNDPTGGEWLNAQLIGINIERTALSAMPPTDNYLAGGQTVQQRLDQLAEQKEAIHVLTGQADPLWRTLSEQDWLDYHAQLAASGEAKALQWLVSNRGHL